MASKAAPPSGSTSSPFTIADAARAAWSCVSDVFSPSPPPPSKDDTADITVVMTLILLGQLAVLSVVFVFLTPAKGGGRWLPPADTDKGAYERFVLAYSPVWMGVFAVIIAGQLYETFTAHTYMLVCTTLCLPLFFYPFLAPALPSHAPPPKEASEGDNTSLPSSSTVPSLLQGYPLKATAWLAIYSHIGNYWYTHYFYTVLGASYSMPSLRLNDVPLPLYFATFFYFSTYHALSNLLLRRVTSGYQRTPARGIFLLLLLLALSYCTAFMETLTISAFPYYSFQDPFMAFTVGSAFYGLYFLVSFPAFFRLDEFKEGRLSLYQSAMDALGAGMLILILLDAVRLWLGMPLTMAGQALRY